MRKHLKFLPIAALTIGLMSFSTIKTHSIELTNSGSELQNNKFELKNDTYLLNRGQFETLYVEVSSKSISGKSFNETTAKKEKIQGTKYTL